ncbi:hypothetical protein Scep_024199 [Stephania cephalantha]|uniref:ATP-dependent DNA helicase n=1 Tax=Stephania cephalantha TaxID=152367 RepID=A0AAP0HY65_9MAGN
MEGERYYLRLLLNHIKGCTSFQELKVVNGVHASSYKEAVILHMLLDADNSLDLCLEEASAYQMPFTLRRLFSTILLHCDPENPRHLCEKFRSELCLGFERLQLSVIETNLRALQHINIILESKGKNITDFSLVDYPITFDDAYQCNREIDEKLSLTVDINDLEATSKLNLAQKNAYDSIIDKVLKNVPALFFIDGPGGTGKTFLYKAILAKVRSEGMIALATASSGVAASLLPGGRTAHSRFKLPINLDGIRTCNVSKQSMLAKLLLKTHLVIWDEAPMSNKQHIEALDSMLRDVTDKDIPFGGKEIVFGGDFRQVLPVVPKGNRQDVMKSTLATSYIWPLLEKIKLVENIRARLDPKFSKFILRVGNGTEDELPGNMISIPSNITLPYVDEQNSLEKLITKQCTQI